MLYRRSYIRIDLREMIRGPFYIRRVNSSTCRLQHLLPLGSNSILPHVPYAWPTSKPKASFIHCIYSARLHWLLFKPAEGQLWDVWMCSDCGIRSSARLLVRTSTGYDNRGHDTSAGGAAWVAWRPRHEKPVNKHECKILAPVDHKLTIEASRATNCRGQYNIQRRAKNAYAKTER